MFEHDYCTDCGRELTAADGEHMIPWLCLDCWRSREKVILDDMIKQYPFPLPPVE